MENLLIENEELKEKNVELENRLEEIRDEYEAVIKRLELDLSEMNLKREKDEDLTMLELPKNF